MEETMGYFYWTWEIDMWCFGPFTAGVEGEVVFGIDLGPLHYVSVNTKLGWFLYNRGWFEL
jgi:hypothetical protein